MSAVPSQAMLLAAGLGKRMRPLTDTMPKPMIEVGGRTLADRALDRLVMAGVQRVVVNSSYKAQMLESHLAQRSVPQLVFSREAEPLETGGGIARALHYFGGAPFFSVNGDIIWVDGKVPALARLAKAWDDVAGQGIGGVLLLHPVTRAVGYDGKGDFHLRDDGTLVRRAAEETAPYVFSGVQILHPRLFDGCPKGAFSLNLLYNSALAATPQRIKAVVDDGMWLHVGDPTGKANAEAYLSALALD
jgi:MurNAc alpha-1-phosphate uridylyltransferase